jgi:Leucine-rich repeat (LRR) protein
MYVYLDFDTSITDAVRAKAGQPTRIYKPAGKLEDKNTRIYGASMISDIGDLAPFFIESPDFAKGVRLSTLKIGDLSADYTASSELTSLTLGSNKMLEVLDLRGCQDLKIGLDLSGCTGLKELYTERSGITGVTFAEGGLIETAKLNAIGALKAHNLKNLTEFSMTNYLSLTSLNVENTAMLSTKEFLDKCKNATTLRMIGVNWNLTASADSTFLDKFLDDEKYAGLNENNITIDLPVFSGKADFFTIKESQYTNYTQT